MKKYIISVIFILISFKPINSDPLSVAVLSSINASMGTLVSLESIMKSESLKNFQNARDIISKASNVANEVYKNVKGGQEVILFYENLKLILNTTEAIFNNIGKHKDLLAVEEIELLTHMLDYISLEISIKNQEKFKFKRESLASKFEKIIKYVESTKKNDQSLSFIEMTNLLREVNEKILQINNDLYIINKYAKIAINQRRYALGLYNIEVYRDIVYRENLKNWKEIKKYKDLSDNIRYNKL